MIYLDTSVVLAHLFAEELQPAEELWRETLVSSRLLEYEVWTRIHARGLTAKYQDAARDLLARVSFVELTRPALARVLEPLPTPVRTLDGLHLASILFLRGLRQDVRLATFDARMIAAAKALEIPLY